MTLHGKMIATHNNQKMTISKTANTILDVIVPFGPFLLNTEGQKPFANWKKLVLSVIPFTFFVYWIFSLIPFIGTLTYIAILVPLSARRHIRLKNISTLTEKSKTYLLYFVAISMGFGGLWNFIGHTFLADSVASQIGWAAGSPFQTELAFFTLGSGIAALLAIWLRGHSITALVVTKSVFLYGAAYVHIHDAILYQNYAPLNIGTPLIGDIIFPTVFLALLFQALKGQSKPAV